MRIVSVLILLVVAVMAVGLVISPLSREKTPASGRGLIAGSVGLSTHSLMTDAGIVPYHPAPVVDGVPVVYNTSPATAPSPEDGPFLFLVTGVRLIIGETGGLDMDTLGVEIADSHGTFALSFTGEPPLGPGRWIIAKRSGLTPFWSADADNILEPGEQFDLLLYSPALVRPDEEVTVRLLPPGAVPYRLTGRASPSAGRTY